jgi:HSP20 family protein
MLGCLRGTRKPAVSQSHSISPKVRTMAFARWDPIHDLLAIQQRLSRLSPGPTGWVPPIDVHETPDDYVITAELPGLGKDDIHIYVNETKLELSGERSQICSPCEQYHRVERGHGRFSRTFQFPLPVDAERIAADLRDGVLTVTCPKASDPGARRIRVS